MQKRNFSTFIKVSASCLQGVCIAILALCAIVMNYWLDGTYDIAELSRSFEETTVFLRDTEDTVRRKIECTRNIAIFQTNGDTDLNKEIDIRQYISGISDSANRNDNTTYLLCDLINYYPQVTGLISAIASVTVPGSPMAHSDGQTWESLCSAASSYVTILPISGIALEDTAKVSSTPFETLLEYYEDLAETSSDLYERYQSYNEHMESPEGTSSAEAPSNIAYYIEDTATKTVYTNMGLTSVLKAREAISGDDTLTFLFDGIRTMDIMVAMSENALNDTVISKFIDTEFLGSNERVVLAVNLDYPVGDELRADYMAYQKREPIIFWTIIVAVIVLILLFALMAASFYMTGRKNKSTIIELSAFDRTPTEIAVGTDVVIALIWFYVGRRAIHLEISEQYRQVFRIFFLAIMYEVILQSALGIVRRARWKTLWTNSVMFTVVRVSSRVLGAKVTSGRILFVFAFFVVANFLFLRYLRVVGVAIVIVMDLALLLYLMRDRMGWISVREGLRELSKGRFDYKIDTDSLTGDSLEMAKAVNDMGDGLQEAVNSIVKSERLKAELITNVSHDLKTPLTSIISYVDLLKRENLKDQRAAGYIEIIDRKSQRLKSLINDLIDASRISSGNVELNMEKLDFRDLILMAFGEFEERFEAIPLIIELQGCLRNRAEPGASCCGNSLFEGGTGAAPEGGTGQKSGAGQDIAGAAAFTAKRRDPVIIRADGQQLWRVLDNLLENIIKYAKPYSEVRISLTTEEGRAEASFFNESETEIHNSGQELEERFTRGDSSRNMEGSGLGLSIAKSLIELMGASFRVKTTTSTFCAYISFSLE